MNINIQIQKETTYPKFNPNSRNPKEAGLSCLHKACISPSLTILAELLKDASSNALVVDNHFKTAAQRAPKIYLTSFKIAIRYERRHFGRNIATCSFLKPGKLVEEHDMDEDLSILEIEKSNRSIPHEISISAQMTIATRLRNTQTSTSIKNSHLTVSKTSIAPQSMTENVKVGNTKFSIFSKREVHNEEVQISFPYNKPYLSNNKDTWSNSVSVSSKFNVVSSKKIESSEMLSDYPGENQGSPDLAKLRKRLMEQLQSPVIIGNLAESPGIEEPLAQKVRSYCNYGNKFNLNKYLLDKNPFVQIHRSETRQGSEIGTRPQSIYNSNENTSLQRITLQDNIIAQVNSVVI